MRIDLAPEAVAQCIEEVGFGFMFAPAHHGATRFVVPVRKELAVRTIFNFLGPLTNPAGATRQVIGVSDPAFLEVIAGALARLGADRALVVSSADGLDELSTAGATHVVEVDGGAMQPLRRRRRRTSGSPRADLRGRGRRPARTRTRRPRAGSSPATPGPQRDLAVLNAGAAIYAAGRADDLATGVRAAEAAIDGGRRGRGARPAASALTARLAPS